MEKKIEDYLRYDPETGHLFWIKKASDKRDNSISNLRCTNSQNKLNEGRRKSNKSGLKGVSYSNKKYKWVAQIFDKHLGYFKTKEEAHEAYKEAAKRLAGEFARW